MYPAGIPGITVRYVEIAPRLRVRVLESGSVTGRAVILVHGWGASVYSYAETIPALAITGHRVIAIDLPGHGLSDKPTTQGNYTTDSLCRAVLRVADELQLQRFSYIGHSLGGSLGLELAVRGERRLDKLVLISSVGIAWSPLIPPLRLLSPRLVNRFAPTMLTRTLYRAILNLAFATKGRPTEFDIDQYWAPSQFPEYAWACRACVHEATWRPQPATRLRGLRLPVLVLAGRRDYLVRETVERAKLIPTARTVSMRDGGHLMHQELAERANMEIVNFLRS